MKELGPFSNSSETTESATDLILCSMRSLSVKPDRDSEALDFRAASELLRRTLFDAQDEIDRRREQIIADIEGKLQQRVAQEILFLIRWTLA